MAKIKTGKKIKEEEIEEHVYTDEGREELIDDDEIDPREEGFMQGYEMEKRAVKCTNCNEILDENYIERDIDNETLKFCSEECFMKFKKKHA